ncbi:YjbF family lipoprotein [Yoonia sp. R2-816]|uniref:YjbF family lipoprotein n=1 Tax=Yoonia sp. R2-816 TaxID=3342638 RepID=UPI00372B10C0
MTLSKWFMAAGAVLIGLSACGPLNEGSTASQLGGLVMGRVTGAETQPVPGSSVPQDQILSNPGKYIRVNIRDLNRWDTSVQAGSNANRATWVDSANISVTFENGIVVATRGLVRDLMAADVSQSWAAIRSGGGEAQRVHEFLTNMDGISTELLQCRIASQGREVVERLQIKQNTTRFEEKCGNENLQFANVYWVNDAGTIIRSLQAISPDAGYLQIDIF